MDQHLIFSPIQKRVQLEERRKESFRLLRSGEGKNIGAGKLFGLEENDHYIETKIVLMDKITKMSGYRQLGDEVEPHIREAEANCNTPSIKSTTRVLASTDGGDVGAAEQEKILILAGRKGPGEARKEEDVSWLSRTTHRPDVTVVEKHNFRDDVRDVDSRLSSVSDCAVVVLPERIERFKASQRLSQSRLAAVANPATAWMSDHHSKKRMKTLFSFYKKDVNNQGPTSETPVPCNDSPNSLPINEMEIPSETETGNPPIIVDAPKESPHSPVQADPGLRQLICTFSVNEQDRIRREYLLMGPHQPKLNNYPQTFDGREKRRFQHRWFTLYP
ncbi:hypothetical protein QQ045_003383 [Rhodiola kirilowii]